MLARIRVKDELVPKKFVAKPWTLILPIELDFESGMFVVLKLKGEEGPSALDLDRSLPLVLPSNRGVSLNVPQVDLQRILLISMGCQGIASHVVQ